MNELNQKQTIKLLKNKWNKLSYVLNNKSWSKYADELLKVNLEESKNHDRFRGDSINRGLSIREEAVFFAVQSLVNYAFNFDVYKPKAEDFMHVRKSLFISFALANEFKDDIKAEFSLEEAYFINGLDYCKLIKGE